MLTRTCPVALVWSAVVLTTITAHVSAQPCQPVWLGVGNMKLDYYVGAMTVFDNGTGPALYVGGEFLEAGGVVLNNVAKWNGTSWAPLGSGVSGYVYALAVFDDGNGPALYAGGDFSVAGVVLAHNVAKWDGTSWSPLGDG